MGRALLRRRPLPGRAKSGPVSVRVRRLSVASRASFRKIRRSRSGQNIFVIVAHDVVVVVRIAAAVAAPFLSDEPSEEENDEALQSLSLSLSLSLSCSCFWIRISVSNQPR